MCHVLACAWFVVGDMSLGGDGGSADSDIPSWLSVERRPLLGNPDDPVHRYSQCLYFVFVTLATVGYGDIHGHSTAEIVFSMFIIMLGASVYASLLSSSPSSYVPVTLPPCSLLTI